MATIHVDGRPYEVNERDNLLEACLALGFDLPYFCWHPAMGSVGACRQCAVRQYKDENDDQGAIVMACMTPAADGSRLSIDDAEARDFRASVIEWLMANHPHDCPVCAEGGECHLQDMTVMTGHTYRRFRFAKRTHRNQYLGPFISHEMNRCIACYRCFRFYCEYAGGDDLDVFAMHHHVYFGRQRDGTLENEFSGNLVEVCPTGVFTDKPLTETYTRKWDLRTTPSICNHCGVGCNTSPGERYGSVKRMQNRYHGAVNGYFLCDRGRYGFDFVNLPQRLRTPTQRPQRQSAGEAVNPATALAHLRQLLADKRVVGIGSPRATLEANHALRTAVGAERFHDGLSALDHRLAALICEIHADGSTRVPTLTEMEHADAVLVLGEDLTNTAPRIALSLRQSARNRAFETARGFGIFAWQEAAVRNTARYSRTPFFLSAPHTTRLDNVASRVDRRAIPEIARLGAAVAQALDGQAPAIGDLDENTKALADEIAAVLRDAKRPLIVSGYGAASEAVIRAAANIARALAGDERRTDLCLTVPEANIVGLALMQANPTEQALAALENGDADTVVIAENDLYERAPCERVDAALARAKEIVVLDVLPTATTERADLLLPVTTFAESDGTLVSYEGRAQRFFKLTEPEGALRETWRWLGEAGQAAWANGDANAVTRDCASTYAALAGIAEAAPPADFRIAGMQMARAPHRYSGRTAMHADADVAEDAPPRDPETPLSMTMEGHHPSHRQPAAVLPYFWAPRWNSVQSVNKFQAEIGGALVGGDAGVRLLEPAESFQRDYFREALPAAAASTGEWLVTPFHHIFGSEPLSRRSRPIAERVSDAYVALHPDDAREAGLDDEDTVTVELDQQTYRLPLRYEPGLARRTVGLPVGLPNGPTTAPVGTARLRSERSP